MEEDFPGYFANPDNLSSNSSGSKVESRIKHSYPRESRKSHDSQDMVVDISPTPERTETIFESRHSSESVYETPVSEPLSSNLDDTIEDKNEHYFSASFTLNLD